MGDTYELTVAIRLGDQDDLPWDFMPHPEVGDRVHYDACEFVVVGREWEYDEDAPTLTFVAEQVQEPSE